MTAQAMITLARSQIGYRETGNNDTKYNRWLGRIPGYPHNGYGYPWCHSFLSWLLAQTGNASAGPRTAGCAVGVAWFRQRGRYHSSPKVGDFVYYGTGGSTHVELVTAVSSSSITTIGGNTSGSLSGQYFNGDGVYQKSVSRSSSRIHCYGRPLYTASGGTTPTSGDEEMLGLREGDKGEAVKSLQTSLRHAGFGAHLGAYGPQKDGVDGHYGSGTSKAVLACRKWMGSSASSGKSVTGSAAAQIRRAVARREAQAAVKATK